MDRDIPGARVGLELVHHLPAINARQADVENDCTGAIGPRVLQTLLAITTDMAFQTIIRGQLKQDASKFLVILNDKNRLFAYYKAFFGNARGRRGDRLLERRYRWRILLRRRAVIMNLVCATNRQEQHEGGSLAHAFTGHAYIATQQARQLTGNRQAQAGAAVLAAGRAISLLECFENKLLLFRRNTDAGIDHR